MHAGLQYAVVLALHEHLAGPRGAGLQMAGGEREQGQVAVAPREAGGLDLLVGGAGMVVQVALHARAHRAVVVEQAGAAFHAERPARTGQVAEPVVSHEHVAAADRDVAGQALSRHHRLCRGGDVGLEHAVAAQVRPGGPRPVAHVDGAPGVLGQDAVDPGHGAFAQVAGEHVFEVHALAVDPGVDLGPLRRRRHRAHDVHLAAFDEPVQRVGAQELVLGHGHADGRGGRRLGAPGQQFLLQRRCPSERREQAGVEDHRVVVPLEQPARGRAHHEVHVGARGPRVLAEGVEVVAHGRAQRVLHQAVDHQDALGPLRPRPCLRRLHRRVTPGGSGLWPPPHRRTTASSWTPGGCSPGPTATGSGRRPARPR